MKHLFLIFLFCIAANLLQAQQITNVLATQDGDNVNITFDITEAKKGQSFDIEVKCSTDGGSKFTIFPASLSGDIKAVTAGTNKLIIWNVLQDRDEIVGENIVFELTATVKGGKSDFSGTNGTFTDKRDGHFYKWVKIGKQVWMAENLAYNTGSDCWAYDNINSNVTKYGYLYNFETANKVCPSAWHLPSDEEWTTLEIALGMSSSYASSKGWRGAPVGSSLKSATDWSSSGNGNNESGFAALPGGYRYYKDGTFSYEGGGGYWWSSTAFDASKAYYRYLSYYYAEAGRNASGKQEGFSVRCIRD